MPSLSYSAEEILETVNMVRLERLDIRTVTVGISLLDCVGGDIHTVCRKIVGKITRVAGNLKQVTREIEQEFGIPIVNNRVSVTPLALIAGEFGVDGIVRIARALDEAAAAIGIDFV